MYLYFWGFLVLTLIFLCLTKIKKVTKNNVIMCLSLFAIFVYIANLITVGNQKEVKTTNQKKNKHVKLSVLNNRLVFLEGYSYGNKHENFSINYPIATDASDSTYCPGGEIILKSDTTLPLTSTVNSKDCGSNNSCNCYDSKLDTDIEKIIKETVAWVEKLEKENKIEDYKSTFINGVYNFELRPRQLAHIFSHTHKSRANMIIDLFYLDRDTYDKISRAKDKDIHNSTVESSLITYQEILEKRLKSGYPSNEHHNVRLLLVIDILKNIKLGPKEKFNDLQKDIPIGLTHRHKISDTIIKTHISGDNNKECKVSDITSSYHNLESLDNPELRVMELWNNKNGNGQWLTDITDIGKGQKLFIYLVVSKILDIPVNTDIEGLKKFFVFEERFTSETPKMIKECPNGKGFYDILMKTEDGNFISMDRQCGDSSIQLKLKLESNNDNQKKTIQSTQKKISKADKAERDKKEEADKKAEAAKEKVAKEKAAKEKATKEKVAKEKVAKGIAAKQKVAQEKAAKQKVAQEKAAKEKAAKEKAAKEKTAKEKPEKKRAGFRFI